MWLLLDEVLEKIIETTTANLGFQIDDSVASAVSRKENGPLAINSETQEGVIRINGVLSETFDFFAFLAGGGMTLYPDIIRSLQEAEANANVKTIILDVNSSPGGSIDGLFAAMDAIRAVKKPVKAFVRNVAASATYGLISQADEISVLNGASRVGSIGIVAKQSVNKDDVEIASTNAPKKRPDVTTEEGKEVVREQVDKLHDLFVGAISKGRGISADAINKNFGQGAIVLAKDALKAGMIDRIGAVESASIEITAARGEQEAGFMDLQKLKAEFPDVYAAAVKAGVDQERDRVQAHLELGDASGDMDTAKKAIESGEGLTAMVQAKYLAANMRRQEIVNREADNEEVKLPETSPNSPEAFEEQVLSLVEKQLGIVEGEA
jgi:ClpP class serine protease